MASWAPGVVKSRLKQMKLVRFQLWKDFCRVEGIESFVVVVVTPEMTVGQIYKIVEHLLCVEADERRRNQIEAHCKHSGLWEVRFGDAVPYDLLKDDVVLWTLLTEAKPPKLAVRLLNSAEAVAIAQADAQRAASLVHALSGLGIGGAASSSSSSSSSTSSSSSSAAAGGAGNGAGSGEADHLLAGMSADELFSMVSRGSSGDSTSGSFDAMTSSLSSPAMSPVSSADSPRSKRKKRSVRVPLARQLSRTPGNLVKRSSMGFMHSSRTSKRQSREFVISSPTSAGDSHSSDRHGDLSSGGGGAASSSTSLPGSLWSSGGGDGGAFPGIRLKSASQVHSPSATHKGIMFVKLGGSSIGGRQWKKRYYRLENGELLHLSHEGDVEPKSKISLAGMLVTPLTKQEAGRQHAMLLRSTNTSSSFRSLTLAAASEYELPSWLLAFDVHVTLADQRQQSSL